MKQPHGCGDQSGVWAGRAIPCALVPFAHTPKKDRYACEEVEWRGVGARVNPANQWYGDGGSDDNQKQDDEKPKQGQETTDDGDRSTEQ